MIGTFSLVAAALRSPTGQTFALVGLTLLVMVIAIGKVSGAHLNPAVIVGLITARQFPWRGWTVRGGAGDRRLPGLRLWQAGGPRPAGNRPRGSALWFKSLGTALLVFVVTRVVMAKLSPAASALGSGLALSVAIAIAGPSSGGMLNPAIALVLLGNLSSGSLVTGLLYLVVPVLAGAGAALIAVYLAPECPPETEREELTAQP